MNENTLREKIKELEIKIKDTFDPVEKATMSEEIKKLRVELSKFTSASNDKDITLKTNIDAPIVGDRKNNGPSSRPGQFVGSGAGDTFLSII